ncbi:hypothetical protein E2C01_059770 [Portunus trituberculatus]|uniref:Uncharacterized protein n=1 Tax=Portunus trituberculatus TaxID=210409 RepID=A0A5B7H3I2_PORTR|nr:hypothetical protein [Portunus trituberculatus]
MTRHAWNFTTKPNRYGRSSPLPRVTRGRRVEGEEDIDKEWRREG